VIGKSNIRQGDKLLDMINKLLTKRKQGEMVLKKAVLVGVFLVAGCGVAPVQIMDRGDYLAEGTRLYPNESKERVIQAAETILKTSDPTKIDMRYVNDGFTALRRYFVYAVIVAASGQEKWEFHTEERARAIEASLSISEAGVSSGPYTSTPYEGAMKSIPLYRLFWQRMDYMLGRRPDWVSCEEAEAPLKSSGTNTVAALSGLCGPTSPGRADVPQQLPRKPVTAGERMASERATKRAAVMNAPSQ
jgi:hypothetical protein